MFLFLLAQFYKFTNVLLLILDVRSAKRLLKGLEKLEVSIIKSTGVHALTELISVKGLEELALLVYKCTITVSHNSLLLYINMLDDAVEWFRCYVHIYRLNLYYSMSQLLFFILFQ